VASAKMEFGGRIEVVLAENDAALDDIVKTLMGKLGVTEFTDNNRSVIQLSDEKASSEDIVAATEAAALLQGFVVIAGAKQKVRWSIMVTISTMLRASFEAARAIGQSA